MSFKRVLHVYEGRVTPFPDNFAGIVSNLIHLGYDAIGVDINQLSEEDYHHVIRTFSPDLVTCFTRSGPSNRKVAVYHKNHNSIPIANWFTEDPNYMAREDGFLALSQSFDFWFTINKRMVPFYKGNAYFLPPGFDQFYYYDRCLKRNIDVAFIGQLGHARSEASIAPFLLKTLPYKYLHCTEKRVSERPKAGDRITSLLPDQVKRAARKFNLVFKVGPQPDEVIVPYGWYRPRDEYEKALVNCRSKIVLGLSRVRGYWEERLQHVFPQYSYDSNMGFYQPKGRTFEGVGCGAMVINDYFEELEEMFEIDKEIVTFAMNDADEFADKLKFYLEHDDLREKIAKGGYRRAMREHTMAKRLERMIGIIQRGGQ